MNRNEQVNWIREQAEIALDADHGGDEQAEDIAKYWHECMEIEGEIPAWFDDHDLGLLTGWISEAQLPTLAQAHFDRQGGALD